MATADAVHDGSEGDEFSDRDHRQGTSGELTDPWCDLCFGKTNIKIDASGFCPESNSFLCKSCLDHKRFHAMENYRILQGERMPKTQADRPVKYSMCNIHGGHVKDHFCMDHSKMVCSRCIDDFHMTCKQKLILDLCKDLGSIDIQELRDDTETIKKNINSVKNNIERNKDIMESQKNEMIKEATQLRDKQILKIQNAYSSTISNINNVCDEKLSQLSKQVYALSDMIFFLEQTLSKIDEIIGADITPNVFIKLQNTVANVRQSQVQLAELGKQRCKVALSFSTPSRKTTETKTLAGRIARGLMDLVMPIPEIVFPSLSRKINKFKIARDIKQVESTKTTPLNVKMIDDKEICDITGMAVSRNHVLLLTDWNNKKVKTVSPDNKLLSFLRLSDQPFDISVIDDTLAAVATNNEKIHILDITDPGSLALQRSVSLGYSASSVAACNNNLVVSKWAEPGCVKLITRTGAEMWSVPKDHNSRQLFEKAFAITTSIVNDKVTVIVADWGKETLTLLDANNGNVIKIVDVKGKVPLGLTVDNDGNVYLCCRKQRDICVWSADLVRVGFFCQSKIYVRMCGT